ncbi:hypothetical protein [Pseudomonas sp. BNK-30]
MAKREENSKACIDKDMLARIQEAAKKGAMLGYQMVLKDSRNRGPSR